MRYMSFVARQLTWTPNPRRYPGSNLGHEALVDLQTGKSNTVIHGKCRDQTYTVTIQQMTTQLFSIHLFDFDQYEIALCKTMGDGTGWAGLQLLGIVS